MNLKNIEAYIKVMLKIAEAKGPLDDYYRQQVIITAMNVCGRPSSL